MMSEEDCPRPRRVVEAEAHLVAHACMSGSLTLLRHYAQQRFADACVQAVSTESDARQPRRREILFAVCFADSYLYEWVRDHLDAWMKQQGRPGDQWDEFFDLFPPADRRGVTERWREIPRSLADRGLIPGAPDLGGTHGEEWKRLVAFRDGVVHGKLSRPDRSSAPPEELAVPTAEQLRTLPPGWAVRVVVERVRLLHLAAGTQPPAWLSPAL